MSLNIIFNFKVKYGPNIDIWVKNSRSKKSHFQLGLKRAIIAPDCLREGGQILGTDRNGPAMNHCTTEVPGPDRANLKPI